MTENVRGRFIEARLSGHSVAVEHAPLLRSHLSVWGKEHVSEGRSIGLQRKKCHIRMSPGHNGKAKVGEATASGAYS